MSEKSLQDELAAPAFEKQKRALKLIHMMKTDVQAALTAGAPLVIQGEGPLGALLTVLGVAEKATVEKLTPILGADGKLVS